MGVYAICRGCKDKYGTSNQCMSANYSSGFPGNIIKDMKCPHGYDWKTNWEAIEGRDYPNFPYNAVAFETQEHMKKGEG